MKATVYVLPRTSLQVEPNPLIQNRFIRGLECKEDGKVVMGLVSTTDSSIEEKEKAYGLAFKWNDLTMPIITDIESCLQNEILPRDWTYLDFKILRKMLKKPDLQNAAQVADAMNQARSDQKCPIHMQWWRRGGAAGENKYTAEEVTRAVKYLDWRLPDLRVKHSRAWTEAEINALYIEFKLNEPLATFARRLNPAGQFSVGEHGWVDYNRLSVEKILDNKLQFVAQDRLWGHLQLRPEVLTFFGIEWKGREFGDDVPFSSDDLGSI